MQMVISMATEASFSEFHKRSLTSSVTGRLVRNDTPKSPRMASFK